MGPSPGSHTGNMGNLATTPAQVEEAEGGFEMIPEGGLQSSHEDGAPGESSEKSTSQDVTMLARRTSIPQSHHEEDKVDADDQMDDQAVDEVSLGDYVLFKRPASRANASAPHLGKGSFATYTLASTLPPANRWQSKSLGSASGTRRTRSLRESKHFHQSKWDTSKVRFRCKVNPVAIQML